MVERTQAQWILHKLTWCWCSMSVLVSMCPRRPDSTCLENQPVAERRRGPSNQPSSPGALKAGFQVSSLLIGRMLGDGQNEIPRKVCDWVPNRANNSHPRFVPEETSPCPNFVCRKMVVSESGWLPFPVHNSKRVPNGEFQQGTTSQVVGIESPRAYPTKP